tara:strand:+ start:25431 stop:25571 length:141 start_codon:yes stop_codon:yes gene_type:complete
MTGHDCEQKLLDVCIEYCVIQEHNLENGGEGGSTPDRNGQAAYSQF